MWEFFCNTKIFVFIQKKKDEDICTHNSSVYVYKQIKIKNERKESHMRRSGAIVEQCTMYTVTGQNVSAHEPYKVKVWRSQKHFSTVQEVGGFKTTQTNMFLSFDIYIHWKGFNIIYIQRPQNSTDTETWLYSYGELWWYWGIIHMLLIECKIQY